MNCILSRINSPFLLFSMIIGESIFIYVKMDALSFTFLEKYFFKCF